MDASTPRTFSSAETAARGCAALPASTAHNLLTTADPPTAVFVANNVLAEGIWRAATELGLDIPNRLSLVSFDDAAYTTVGAIAMQGVRQADARLGASV